MYPLKMAFLFANAADSAGVFVGVDVVDFFLGEADDFLVVDGVPVVAVGVADDVVVAGTARCGADCGLVLRFVELLLTTLFTPFTLFTSFVLPIRFGLAFDALSSLIFTVPGTLLT
jgi:hypothetical protein